MEPETRTLFDAESEVADAYVQEAIPWCTVHNTKGVRPNLVCDLAQFAEFPVTDCNISTGGPEHKWWKDI